MNCVFSVKRVYIQPERPNMLLLEEDVLQIDCVQEYTLATDDEIKFKKGEQIITFSNNQGFKVTSLKFT